jgi:hypothetical protein
MLAVFWLQNQRKKMQRTLRKYRSYTDFTFFQMAHSVFVSPTSSPRKQLSSKKCTKKGGHEKSAAESKNSSIGCEEMSVFCANFRTEGRYHQSPEKVVFARSFPGDKLL